MRTLAGITHDINDLSSGEKEVLYGYLRISNLAPRQSVLLVDEPELRLNPRLIRGLPQFYPIVILGARFTQSDLVFHALGCVAGGSRLTKMVSPYSTCSLLMLLRRPTISSKSSGKVKPWSMRSWGW